MDPKEARRRARAKPSAKRLAAALLDRLARARRFLRDLRVLQVVALALGVGARDALPALERAQRLLRPRAVFALGLTLPVPPALCFSLLLLRVFLALAEAPARA